MSNYNSINNYSEYYQTIKSDIQGLISDNLTPSEAESWAEFQEYVFDHGFLNEIANSNCIYYIDCSKIIEFSDNELAYEDACAELTGSFNDIKQIVAYYANEADLQDYFNDYGEDYFNEYVNDQGIDLEDGEANNEI